MTLAVAGLRGAAERLGGTLNLICSHRCGSFKTMDY